MKYEKNMIKVMIIDFIRHNCWGTTDMATHYYVNGKRISKNTYYRSFSNLHNWIDSKFYSKTKDGIDRNYTEMYYKSLDN